MTTKTVECPAFQELTVVQREAHRQKASAALRRAAVSYGDSDSIACLTGAFTGAYHGMGAWPTEWGTRIEYRDRLVRLGEAWD